jgi:hypothetical protein
LDYAGVVWPEETRIYFSIKRWDLVIQRLIDEDPSKAGKKSVESRKDFYDWLANEIKIDGIVSIERDIAFDNKILRVEELGCCMKAKKSRLKALIRNFAGSWI